MAANPSFFEIVKQANLEGWHVLNCFQYGFGNGVMWRVNLQKRGRNGMSENVFTEFADDPDPHKAMWAAYQAAHSRGKEIDKRTRPQATMPAKSQPLLSPQQERRLKKAVDANWIAVMNGTRSQNRKNGL